MTDTDARRELPGETLEQYGDRIAAATREKLLDRLDDDVIGRIRDSHLIFGKACAMEAVTTAMNEMADKMAEERNDPRDLAAERQALLDRIEALEAGLKIRPIEEAAKNADWICGWFKVGFTIRPIPIHWASDLSGEEQPPFQGWFEANGSSGFREADMKNFIGWEPLNEKAARALLKGTGDAQ